MDTIYQIPEYPIAHYTCRYITEPIRIDGDLDKPVWKAAEQSRSFVDMVTGEPGFLETRMASLWDRENLYRLLDYRAFCTGKPYRTGFLHLVR